MYRRISQSEDGTHFGTQITIYKSENNFLVIEDGRDGRIHYFADLQLTRLYPVKLHAQINTAEATLDYTWDIDLQKCGFSKCPDWVLSLISRTEDNSPA
jgi:hypothetical protein